MAEIRIRLIGNVAFENDMKLSEGFRYDIPVDRIGIPRIPIARLLPASVIGGAACRLCASRGLSWISRAGGKAGAASERHRSADHRLLYR